MLSERAVMLPKAVLIGLQPNLNKPDKNFIWKGESASFDAAVSPLSPLFAKAQFTLFLSLLVILNIGFKSSTSLQYRKKNKTCVIFYYLCLI